MFGWLIRVSVLCSVAIAAAANGSEAVRNDSHGDPLPHGVMARLGTLRFRQGEAVRALAFSPDGRFLASAQGLWKASAGESAMRLGDGWTVAFSPDNRLVAFAQSGSVIVREVAGGRDVWNFRLPASDTIWSLAFAPDSRVLAAAGGAGSRSGRQFGVIRRWEMATGKKLAPLGSRPGAPAGDGDAPAGDKDESAEDKDDSPEWHRGSYYCIAFSPDGKTLAASSNGVRLWDLRTNVTIREIRLPGRDVWSIKFSPNGLYIAAAERPGAVHLWEADSGRIAFEYDLEEGGSDCVAFSPDGEVLAATCHDQRIRLWHVPSRSPLRTIEVGDREGAPIKDDPFEGRMRLGPVAFSPDGALLAAGCGSVVCFWETHSGQRVRAPAVHESGVRSLGFSPDGKTLASGSRETVLLWGVPAAGLVRRFEGARHPATFFPDGKRLASGAADRVFHVWDLATGKSLREVPMLEHALRSFRFAADGTITALGDADGAATSWVLPPEETLYTVAHPVQGQCLALLASSADGKRMVCSGNEDLVLCRPDDLNDWSEVARLRAPGDRERLCSAAFSPEGRLVATGGTGRWLYLWDAAKGSLVRRVPSDGAAILAIAFSPDGQWLAYGGRQRLIHLAHVATGTRLTTVHGHRGEIWSLAFAPDGRQLASGSADTSVLLWDLSAVGMTRDIQAIEAVAAGDRASTQAAAKALQQYDEALRRDAGFYEALRQRAHLRLAVLRTGYREAIADLDRAIVVNPTFEEAYASRALAHNELGQYDRAVADANHAIDLDPDNAHALNYRAYAYRMKGQYRQALEDLERLLFRNPDYVDAWLNYCRICCEAGEPRKAIELCDGMLKWVKPDDALQNPVTPVHRTRGYAYLLNEQYPEALADFNVSLAKDPGDAPSYLFRSRVYQKQGQADRAQADRLKAIDLDPRLKNEPLR